MEMKRNQLKQGGRRGTVFFEQDTESAKSRDPLVDSFKDSQSKRMMRQARRRSIFEVDGRNS